MKKKEGTLLHVVKSQDFSLEMIKRLFIVAKNMESSLERPHGLLSLHNRVMITLFYEPSTRTRVSFEMAMIKLGGQVISTENAKDFSSAIKGESIEDTIRVLQGYYADVIVIRHFEEGTAAKAAALDLVPIINAGDGKGQHPTQALLDLYTIEKRLHRIDGISIAMVGDLENGRTVRSLSYLLGKFKDVKIYFVSPPCAKIKVDIKEYLNRHGVRFYEEANLKKVVPKVDVVYQTRIQTERGSNFDGKDFIIDVRIMDLMQRNAVLMHPLPRVGEISLEVDQDSRAAYFEQAENGLYIRMALLKMMLPKPGREE